MFNRRSVKVTAEAASTPVSLAELKEYLKIDGSDEDTTLTRMLKAAVGKVENECNRKFIETGLQLRLDRFPLGVDRWDELGSGVYDGHYATVIGATSSIDLPFRPIIQIDSIKTYNTANAETTVDPASYRLDQMGGRVSLNDGYEWPSDLRSYDAIYINFKAGYGATASSVPAPICQSIVSLAAQMYECRTLCDLSDEGKALLDGYRILDGLGWA